MPVVTGATARFVYEIRRLPDGEELASGHTVHACIDARGKVARLPKALRELAQRRSATAAAGSSVRNVNDSVR